MSANHASAGPGYSMHMGQWCGMQRLACAIVVRAYADYALLCDKAPRRKQGGVARPITKAEAEEQKQQIRAFLLSAHPAISLADLDPELAMEACKRMDEGDVPRALLADGMVGRRRGPGGSWVRP